MIWETLYPLPSVRAFINDDLKIYKMNEDGTPDIKQWNYLANVASKWVNYISNEDDTQVSEVIYWSERNDYLEYGI